MKQYPQYPPRYTSTPHSDSESSTHSVRVSRLIEKIKQTQRNSGHLYSHHNSVANNHPEAFNYLGGGGSGSANVNNNSELIYSRVERDNSAGKRTVRESVSSRYGLLNRNSSPPSTRTNHYHHNNNNHNHHHNNHRTTVLLNSEDTSPSDASPYEYESYGTKGFGGGGGATQSSTRPARYFGEETDYEYDRVLSRNVKQQRASAAAASRHYSSATLGRSSQNNNGTAAVNSGTTRQNVPKIILHEEAVAEIPNGKVGGSSSIARSPSREFEYDDETQQQQRGGGGSRFLGGLLTLKRGNKKNVTGSGSMASTGGGTLRSTRSPSSRPYGASAQDSPKYYVPYRSTPTLYESRYERDRMSSAAGSVLSNGSYVNKHVSRSMSMKAPWEPKHRVNEIDYYENSYNARRSAAAVDEPDGVANKKRSKPGLTRSKSMPGKKLTSLIGNWVSKGSAKRAAAANGSEQEKLITGGGGGKGDGSRDANTLPNKGKHGGSGGKDGKSSWGFTLLRGFSRKGNKEKERNGDGIAAHPTKSGTLKKETRTSSSPVRGATLGQKSSFDRGSAGGEIKRSGGGSSSTLLRADRASSAGGTSSTLIRNSYATVDRRKRSGLAARADYY